MKHILIFIIKLLSTNDNDYQNWEWERDKPMNYQRNLLLACLLFLLALSLITIKIQRDTIDLLLPDVYTYQTDIEPLEALNEPLEPICKGTFKSFMPYRAITNSKQYELQLATTVSTGYGS